MLGKYKRLLTGTAAAALLASGTWAGTAAAREVTVPAQKKLVQGDVEVKQLLRLMDKDQNGKVSREEFMTFMGAEFDRLDKDKSGELDVKELTQSWVRTRSPISR